MPIDYSRYPPNWRSEIVPRIRARAGECCEHCGVANAVTVFSLPVEFATGVRRIWLADESEVTRIGRFAVGPAKRVRVVLTVSHLDHDEYNAEVADDRLAALCQWCHLTYDQDEKAQRRAEKLIDQIALNL